MKTVVVGLGGNAVLRKGAEGTVEEQREEIRKTASEIASLIEEGHRAVVTHGNGPQVGRLMLQQEGSESPRIPLDVLVAETQAQIGYLLQQELDNAVETDSEFVTFLTQTVVDPDDTAFDSPTKPVGPDYTEEEAREKEFDTVKTGETYRRVVPSPDPVKIVESDEIARAVEAGTHVICCGGGGVPVVRDGGLRGVEAVVDKDKTSSLMATCLDAEVFVSVTDVEYAYLGYGTDDERRIEEMTPEEARRHIREREFGEGSMMPKVEACADFVEKGGEKGVITTPEGLSAAIEGGKVGTSVSPSNIEKESETD
ncbi:carbamate kinase [Halorutilales archaeon Cl-col2-1]